MARACWAYIRGLPFFLLIEGLRILAARLPAGLLEKLCRRIGRLHYALAGPWRRRWCLRLRDWGFSGRERLILQAKFQQYLLNLADIARLPGMDRRHFRMTGFNYLHAAAASGKGVVLVSLHMGNWELASAGLALYGVPVTLLAWASPNPYIERLQARRRGQYGVDTVHPGMAGIATLLRILDQGGKVGLMLDVNLPGEGLPVQFLGRREYFSPLALLLAMRTGASLLPVLTFRQRDGRCRIIFLPPWRPGDRAHLQEDLQCLAQTLERVVYRHPDQYHWLKEGQGASRPGRRTGHRGNGGIQG